MYLDYEPMTEEQINKIGLLVPGKYKFRCIDAIDSISRGSGHKQIEAHLQIRLDDNSVQNMTAYLSTNGKFMLRMLRHFCEATGLMKEYDQKNLSASVVRGTEGILEIDIKKGGPRLDDPTKTYEDQNKIVDYFPLSSATSEVHGMKPLPEVKDEFNDDITF